MKINEWTIEKVRELLTQNATDNVFGIRRVGEHAWEVGGDIPDGEVIIMGDEAVLLYIKSVYSYILLAEIMENHIVEAIKDGLVKTKH